MRAEELLKAISKARTAVAVARADLADAKEQLNECAEYVAWQNAKEDKRAAELRLDGLLSNIDTLVQPELPDMGQVMRDVARQVNEGALDSEGVKCTAEVHGV